jgi:hypothetical protein
MVVTVVIISGRKRIAFHGCHPGLLAKAISRHCCKVQAVSEDGGKANDVVIKKITGLGFSELIIIAPDCMFKYPFNQPVFIYKIHLPTLYNI